MQTINFQPIFDYIDQRLSPLELGMAEIRQDIREVKTQVANLATDVKELRQEFTILKHDFYKLN